MERYDIRVKRGEDFRRVLIFKKAGAVMDLTGWTGKCQVRPAPDDEELICEAEITISGAEGKVILAVEEDITAGIPAGNYAYDLKMTDGEGNTRYYIGGMFSILPSVSV